MANQELVEREYGRIIARLQVGRDRCKQRAQTVDADAENPVGELLREVYTANYHAHLKALQNLRSQC